MSGSRMLDNSTHLYVGAGGHGEHHMANKMADRIRILERALKECVTEDNAACFRNGVGALRRRRLLVINAIARNALEPANKTHPDTRNPVAPVAEE